VIDSGVNAEHLDLHNDNNPILGWDFVDIDDDPTDVYGHGTHVAGTIRAEDNDNGAVNLTSGDRYGVVGVAPACDLYALRVLDDNGYGYASWLIAAMEWAIVNKVEVANLSLGWDRDPGVTVRDVFDRAESAGMVVVAAAGNSGNPPGRGDNVIYPAKYASVIAVAATDSNDQRASFSSTGEAVEISAPGVSVLSTWNDGDSPYNPQPMCRAINDCYKYGSGTSMASPHVAGVAALIIASGVSDNDEVRQILTSTADDLGSPGLDPQYGYGLVNAAAAVGASPPPPEPIVDIAVIAVEAQSSATRGDTVSVGVTVANTGTVDVTSSITVTLTDTTASVPIDPQMVIGGLAAAASETLTFYWDTSSASIGTHTLEAVHDYGDDDASNDTGTTQVTISDPSLSVSVTGIAPDTMAAGATKFVTIAGTGFVSGATVSFENGVGPAPIAVTVEVASNTKITASVTAKDGGPPKIRVWDVRVTNPDGSSAALEDGFTVTP